MDLDDELDYSPNPSAAAQNNDDGELTEDESGAQGHWSPRAR